MYRYALKYSDAFTYMYIADVLQEKHTGGKYLPVSVSLRLFASSTLNSCTALASSVESPPAALCLGEASEASAE